MYRNNSRAACAAYLHQSMLHETTFFTFCECTGSNAGSGTYVLTLRTTESSVRIADTKVIVKIYITPQCSIAVNNRLLVLGPKIPNSRLKK